MCTKSCASIPAMSEAGNHSWGRLGSPIEKLLALEKVGDQVIKGLGKLRTQVEESLEDARLDVGDLETIKDPRKAFQEKSKRLMKVEDDIPTRPWGAPSWHAQHQAFPQYNRSGGERRKEHGQKGGDDQRHLYPGAHIYCILSASRKIYF